MLAAFTLLSPLFLCNYFSWACFSRRLDKWVLFQSSRSLPPSLPCSARLSTLQLCDLLSSRWLAGLLGLLDCGTFGFCFCQWLRSDCWGHPTNSRFGRLVSTVSATTFTFFRFDSLRFVALLGFSLSRLRRRRTGKGRGKGLPESVQKTTEQCENPHGMRAPKKHLSESPARRPKMFQGYAIRPTPRYWAHVIRSLMHYGINVRRPNTNKSTLVFKSSHYRTPAR